MSDDTGTTPDRPDDGDALTPGEPSAVAGPEIPAAAEVIPPPPPDIPVPEGLLAPPDEDAAGDASAVSRPLRRRSADPARPTPAILDSDPPPAAADDWARPSVAPEAPTSGGYRALTVGIFVFLVVLFVAAVAVIVFLVTTTGVPFTAGPAGSVSAGVALTPAR